MTKKQLLFIGMRVACTLAILLIVLLIFNPPGWVLAVLAPLLYICFDVFGKKMFEKALRWRFTGRLLQKAGMDKILKKKPKNTEKSTSLVSSRPKGLMALLQSAVTYRYAIYFDAPAGSEHQVLMWLPYLSRVPANFVIILRTEGSAKFFRDMGLPVLVISKLADLEIVEDIGVKVILYVNNGMKNTHMLRYHDFTHVQLLHGESDKPSSFNPISVMYDFLFVSGQIAIDRYYDNGVYIPKHKFMISSRPQVENILVKGRDEQPVVWPEISYLNEESTQALSQDGHQIEPIEIDESIKTVFYATTWSGYQEESNFSSIRIAPKLISKLIDLGYRVIFRPHPYSFKDVEQAKILNEIAWLLLHTNRKTGVGHCFSNHPDFNKQFPEITDCINSSDVMISDISSVLADWLASNKPYITMDTGKHEDLIVTNKLSSGGYTMRFNLENLEEILADAVGGDKMSETRKQVRYDALGLDLDDRAEVIFVEKMNYLINDFEKTEHLAPLIARERVVEV